MGIFGGIKDNWKKAEAAALIEGMLEHQKRAGMYDLDPAKSANFIVGLAWEQTPDIFNGSRGVRPHKISIAAAALINAIHAPAKAGKLKSEHLTLAFCLGHILQDVGKNSHLYNFNTLDDHILTSTMESFEEITQELEADMPLF